MSASALCVLARLSWVLRTLEAGFSPFEGIPASARVAAENLVVLRSLRGCRIRTRNSILDLGFGVPSTTVVVFLGCGELKASTRRQGQVTPDRLPTCTWSKREGSPGLAAPRCQFCPLMVWGSLRKLLWASLLKPVQGQSGPEGLTKARVHFGWTAHWKRCSLSRKFAGSDRCPSSAKHQGKERDFSTRG